MKKKAASSRSRPSLKKAAKKSSRPAGRKKTAAKAESPKEGVPKAKPRNAKKTPDKPQGPDDKFPIVGIGASAGGLEALDDFFGHMPPDSGMAFVVVTHQHPGHTSLLPELLAKDTRMPVTVAGDGVRLEPDHVYVAPPGCNLAILNDTLHQMKPATGEANHLPIDSFLRSLAEEKKSRAIGVVLSGTGTDGTLGVKSIKAESGMVMVQEPQSARYAGMPGSAIATGLVDYILPTAEMPAQLIAYVRGPYLNGDDTAKGPLFPEEPLQKIFVLLRSHTGHDFSSYKSSTLRRRIERRMNLHQITNPEHYVRYLQENPHEIDFLFKELLISVTNFFRDPEAWESLAGRPLEDLLMSRPEDHVFRAWVPGCATGEEAFSIAIVMREIMSRLNRRFDVQIFGTDLDSEAIDHARIGKYPEGIAGDVSSARLERYFLHDDGIYSIRNEIREMTIFAPQNVIKDPPFTKLDLISCRNLLIYLDAELQRKLLPVFHYALKPGGLLFLGPSETIGAFSELFDVVDTRWKIFRRKESVLGAHTLPDIPAQPVQAKQSRTPLPSLPAPVREQHLSGIIERLLLGRFAPASVVVSDRGEIYYIHGRTGAYLEPPAGQPRNNILEMAREGLQIELASALRQATSDDEIIRENVRVKSNGDYSEVDLAVFKIKEPEAARGLLLVTFRPSPPLAAESKGGEKQSSAKAGTEERVALIERELEHTRESLQTTVEELETSNEELQSTNEELQSTNEELETSKEEMQSLNEELTTVNAELQSKVEELSEANNDMQNLLNSTDIATIFLDNDLKVKRYTDQAQKLVRLIPTDVGRPIGDLASNLRYDDLASSCRRVLDSLVFEQGEIETKDGDWYLMRIMPYRTMENIIDGIVLTFVNIGELKQIKQSGNRARSFYESIVDTVREPLLILDDTLRVVSANRSFYRTFKTSAKQTSGELIYELGSGQWDIPELRMVLEEFLPKDRSFHDFEVEAMFPKIGKRVFILNGSRLEQEAGLPGMILLAFEESIVS